MKITLKIIFLNNIDQLKDDFESFHVIGGLKSAGMEE